MNEEEAGKENVCERKRSFTHKFKPKSHNAFVYWQPMLATVKWLNMLCNHLKKNNKMKIVWGMRAQEKPHMLINL